MTSTCETPETAGAAPTAPGAPNPYAVLRWLVAATFIVILNETIMINAIPRLMAEFEVTARAAQWLSTAFMLTMAVVIPVTGWFLQRVSTRRAFTTAMTVFCVGTLVAALAPAFPVLLAGRVVQAVGTAVMMPLLMTTLMSVVPERDRGRVMGNVTLAMSVAPALGFGGLVYGLSRLGAVSGGAVSAPTIIATSGAVVAAFVVRQLWLQRASEPLLDLRVLRERTFTVSLLLMSCAFMAMLGSMILLPLYLQDVRGLSALQTGLLVMPGGLLMGLLGPTVGRWYDRLGARPLVVPGSVGILVALAVLSTVTATTSVWLVLTAHVLLMGALAAVFTPVVTVGLGALPMHLYSHGSSLLGTLQQVAAAVGTAVTVTVMSWRAAGLAGQGVLPLDALVDGMRWAFGFSALASVAVVVLAFLLPGRRSRGSAYDVGPVAQDVA